MPFCENCLWFLSTRLAVYPAEKLRILSAIWKVPLLGQWWKLSQYTLTFFNVWKRPFINQLPQYKPILTFRFHPFLDVPDLGGTTPLFGICLVSKSCLTFWDPVDYSLAGSPGLHYPPEFARVPAHQVSDAIQPSHPLSSPSPAFNPSQHQGLFQWVSSLHQVAIVLKLQHQSFQWILRADYL